MVSSAPNKASASSLGGKYDQGRVEKPSGAPRRRKDHRRVGEKLTMVDDDFVQWQLSSAQAKVDYAAVNRNNGPPLRKRKGQLRPVSKQELDESIAALANLL